MSNDMQCRVSQIAATVNLLATTITIRRFNDRIPVYSGDKIFGFHLLELMIFSSIRKRNLDDNFISRASFANDKTKYESDPN